MLFCHQKNPKIFKRKGEGGRKGGRRGQGGREREGGEVIVVLKEKNISIKNIF